MGQIRIRKHLLQLTAVVALAALALVSGLLWMERRNRFPVLEPGAYVGSIQGLFSGEADTPTTLYAEQIQGADQLLIALERPGWKPRIFSGLTHDANGNSSLPISLDGPDGSVRLIGSQLDKKHYVGTIKNLDKKSEGRWELYGIETETKAAAPDDEEATKRWLKIKEDLTLTEDQVHETETRIPQEKEELQKLTAYVTEGAALRATADEKSTQAQKDLAAAQAELKTKQARAQTLDQKLELSQQVTGMGRLVSLARQSLDREGRWTESMIRAGGSASSPEVDEAVARGKRVLELKQQIAAEEAHINELSAEGRTP